MDQDTPTTVTDLDAERAARTTPRGRRGRRTLMAVALAGGLAIGGAGIAAAAQGTTPSASASSSASAPAAPAEGQTPPAPADGQTPPAPPAPGEGPATDGEAPAHEPHLDGTVTSVSDSSFTIQDRDGFTRTIATDGDTTYASAPSAPAPGGSGGAQDGAGSGAKSGAEGATAPAAPEAPASASRGDVLTEGARVHATGTVASDGTTLDATEVGLAPEPPAGGPQGGPQGGPAGPGAGRDGGPRGDRAGAGASAPQGAPDGATAAPSAPAAPEPDDSATAGS